MNGMIIYCERVGGGFWAEPLNALTSLAFIVAAILAWRVYRRIPPAGDGQSRWDLVLMLAVMAALGLASSLWHTFATPWAARADIIAVLALMNIYLIVFVHRVAGLGSFGVLLVLVAFQWLMVQVLNRFSFGIMNGDIFYIPGVAVLWLTALYALARLGREALLFLVGAVLFTASLWLRSSDLMFCPVLPMGTHFLWHLLNALTAYLLFVALAKVVTRSSLASGNINRGLGSTS